MTCSMCGSAAVGIVEQSGGTDGGRFAEHYECDSCGATGTIRGESSAPAAEWTRTGAVFQGGF